MNIDKRKKLFNRLERDAKRNKIKNRKIDKKVDVQVNISVGWWTNLTLIKARTRKSYKRLVEDALSNTYPLEEILKK